ncbi:MAG: PAS domain-containing protein, partial [Myxococcales bacterium]|nr:PAS domain-containing protein [Myxococcales bacterium]
MPLQRPTPPRLVHERFFMGAADLFCIADTAGRMHAANPAWERSLGWSVDELCSRPHFEFVHPDDLAAARLLVKALTNGEAIDRVYLRYRCKDGGYRRLEWRAPPPDPDGLIYASARDVTEAPDALLPADSDAIGSWDYDAARDELRWSPRTHAIHGTSPETFHPRRAEGLRFFPPDALRVLRPALDRLRTHAEPFALELPLVSAQGRNLWVRMTATPELEGGRVVRAFGTFQDVSERRAADEARRVSAEQRRLAKGAAVVGFVDWNIDADTVICDAAAHQILGWPPEVEPIIFTAALESVHDDDREALEEALEAALRPEGKGIDVTFRFRRDDDFVWIRALGEVITRDHRGAPQRVISTIADVSAARRAEEERLRRSERLDQLLGASPVTVYAATPAQGLTFLSANCHEIFGKSSAELRGEASWWTHRIHPDDREAIIARGREWLMG